MAENLPVLAVVAHPDDEMMLSGTLALQARAGLDVTLAVALNGNMGGLPGATPQRRAEVRHQEMLEACRILGIKLEWLGYGDDNFMDRYHNDYPAVEMDFRNLFRRVDPHLLFIALLDDYHHHHRHVAELALNASINASNAEIESQYPPSSMIPWTLHYAPLAGTPFVPSIYVDITTTFDLKIAALKAHKSQHQFLKDHHRTDIFAQVESTARYYGAACGVAFAETFALCERFNRLAPIQQLAKFFPDMCEATQMPE